MAVSGRSPAWMCLWWNYPREGHSNVKTARKATGNHLGYFPKTWFPSMAASKMSCNCGCCSLTSTAACRRSLTAASRMSCSSGRCSSSSTAACQVMGVIDLLLWTAEYQKKKESVHHQSSRNRMLQNKQHYCTSYLVCLPASQIGWDLMAAFVSMASEQEKERLMVLEQRECPTPYLPGDLLAPHHLIKKQTVIHSNQSINQWNLVFVKCHLNKFSEAPLMSRLA